MVRRLGLTMRVARSEYGELRDCLAQDWGPFLADVLPDRSWLPIPNLGGSAVEFARRWELDGLVLTGGNDVGECAERDQTESALLEEFLGSGRPVFGVCRGLQFLAARTGGRLQSAEGHAGTTHAVGPDLSVNSFHNQVVAETGPEFEVWARSAEGWIEAVRHRSLPIVAVMWHPERPGPPSQRELDRRLWQEWASR